MLDKNDIQEIVKALKGVFATKKDLDILVTKEDLKVFAKKKDLDVFPTAKMMNESFETIATKEQVEKIDDRLKRVEEKLENMGDIKSRVKTLEEALEI